jgi:hypothetical protein
MLAYPGEVTNYQQTRTTGQPVYQADTSADKPAEATFCAVTGATAQRPRFVPFSYNIFVAFWAITMPTRKSGASYPQGVLNTEARIFKIRNYARPWGHRHVSAWPTARQMHQPSKTDYPQNRGGRGTGGIGNAKGWRTLGR